MARMSVKRAFEDYVDSIDKFEEKRYQDYEKASSDYENLFSKDIKPRFDKDRKLDELAKQMKTMRDYTVFSKDYSIKSGVDLSFYSSMDREESTIYPRFNDRKAYPKKLHLDLVKYGDAVRSLMESERFSNTATDIDKSYGRYHRMKFKNRKGQEVEVTCDNFTMPKDKKYSKLAQDLFAIYEKEGYGKEWEF